MSLVQRTAKKSPRLIVIGLLIAFVSTIVFASKWDSVVTFAQSVSANLISPQADNQNGQAEIPAPKTQVVNNEALAPLSGTYNIPGDYTDLAAAITDLNLQGVGGAVTLNLVAGNPQTAPAGGYVVGGTGSLVLTTTNVTNTVTIQGNGNTITAPTPQASGVLTDAIFKLVGADWITIAGFNMQENAANTTTTSGTNNMTEFGVALFYVTTTDGAQNNTITGNTIDLNRTYQNTFGIYSNSTHSTTSITTSAPATGAAGGNSGLTIASNNITDVNNGIVVVGSTAAADMNDGLTIGGTVGTANTLTNFGTTGTFSGYANVSGTVNGILVRNTKNANVSFNSITSSAGGVTAGTINGIQFPAFSNAPTGTFTQNVNNNTLSIQSGLISGSINGINILGTSASATSIINVNNNNFTNFGHTVAGTGTITFLTQAGGHFTNSISNNTFTNLTVNTTGSVTFILGTNTVATGGTKTVNNNSIVTGFNKTGAGGTIIFYSDNGSTPASTTTNVTNNNFSNITITGATSVTGISDTDGGAPNKNVTGNTVSNISGGTTGTIIGITTNFDGGTTTISGNTVSNITNGGAITGISTGTSGSGGALTTNIAQNTIHTFTGTGTGAVAGLSIAGTTGHIKNVSRNKIYNLENNNAAGSTSGIVIASGSLTNNVFNNILGDLRTPAVSAANALIGINLTSTTTTSNISVAFNTVYLNAVSTGANFGSSALFATTSATATTANLILKDNILVNTSTAAGTGLTAAYRRSSTTLTNFDSSSNNNDFYAGTPSATNLIFYDGTNSDQTLAAYKARVAPRDSASISENPSFISTTGSNANFLHISAVTPTQLESGGIPVAGITDDFDGNTRNVSTPDIGADEFTGVLLDLAAPAITYTALSNTTLTTNRVLSAVISDASAVASGANSPRIYFKKSTDATYVSTQCVMTGGTPQTGSYDCTINNTLVGGGSVTVGDIIQYFVVAQDTAGNVGANPSAGFAATNVNSVTTPPTTPNSYTIVAAFPASVTVGSGGTYPSLTNTGGLFEAMNASVFNANTTVDILSDLSGETGTVALNQLTEEGAGAGTFTVTIKPSGVARSITGASSTSLIKLSGTDRVTIDGSLSAGTDRSLTITNTGTGTIIWIATNATSGANNNTFKNLIMIGPGAFGGQGFIAGSGTTFGANAEFPNSNNTIRNNDISKVQNGVFVAGGTTPDQIWTIADNTMGSATAANKLSFRGILISNVTNMNVTNNTVSGVLSSTSTSSTMSGIQVSGNISGGSITRNTFKDIKQVNTTGWGSNGIYLTTTSTASNLLIANNFVSDIASQGFNGNEPADNGYGIVLEGTGGGFNIYNNTVVINGNQITATGITAALLIDDSALTAGAINLRNNILANTQTVGTNYSVYVDVPVTNTVFSAIDYNNYFTTENVGNLGGVVRTTLANWQAAVATGQDTNSKSEDPSFVSATDFHLLETSTMRDVGVTIAAVTNDFDGNARPQGAGYEIGADELVVVNPGTIQFNSATYSVTEGTPTVTLTVTRTGGSGGAVTANYTLGGGTATGTAGCGTPGEDYVNTSGSVMFADGDAADKTFTVAICNDAVYELSQTFNATLAIGSGTATLGTPNPATVTINNDDAAPTIAVGDRALPEGNSGTTSFNFTLTVTGPSEVSSFCSIATADGTATVAGLDYSSFGGGFSIPADVNRTVDAGSAVPVSVNGDTMFEANETFFVNLSGCTDCTITDNQGLGTIQNDDVQPTVQFSSATYTNGDDIAQNFAKDDQFAPQVATITVTRTGAAGDAFSVNYATSNGTATGGASCTTGVDYVSTSGTLNFAAGDLLKTFNITVCTDALFEGDETVNLTLTSPTAPVLLGTPSTSVLTITDNETIPTLQFSSATYSNSDDIAKFGVTTDDLAPSVATITVTRTGAPDNAVSVNYATMGGSATGGASCTTGIDYITTSGTLNFASGVNSQTFNVTVCTDGLFEGNETVNLALSNPLPIGQSTLGTPNSAVLTIVDNDAQPSLQFSSPTYSVGEAGPTVTITVTRTGAPDNAVSVNYATVAGGTATGGASCGGAVDYQNAGGTLNFAAGVLSQTFNVSICDDASAESSETVNLALTSPTGAVLGTPNTAVLTITDNDAAPTLQFGASAVSVSESAASVTLTVTRAGATGNAVSVDYATGGGTATAGACAPGVDYVSTSGTLNFASGETSKTFNVTLCNDAVFENNQSFDATLSNPAGGATLGAPSVETVTISNDDAAPTVTINDISQAEGNSGTSGFQTTFTVSGASEAGGGFAFATANNTATSGSDYIAFSIPTVVVPADVNRTTATYNGANITVNGDTTVEPDETFFLNGSSCTSCSFSDNQGLATILNDDTSVQFAQPLYTVSEGVGTVTLTVTRAGSSTGAIGVNYVFAGITANGAASCGAGIDFAAVSGTLNWASGDSAPKTFNVTICEDAVVEGTESFVSQLQVPTGGATIGAQSSTQVDITDNDSDSIAPVITYTPIPSNVSNPTLTVTATDNVGVTGMNIFYSFNGGVYASSACSLSTGTPASGTWSCMIAGTPNPGAIAYYVTATDGTNTATNPVGSVSAPNLFTIGSATIPAGTYTNVSLSNNVMLGGNITVVSSLNISGIVNVGANTLTLGCNATVTGGGETAYVIGNLEKQFCGTGSFTFNVGAAFALPPVAPEGETLAPEGTVSNYSPVTVNITGGTVGSSLTVSATDAFLPGSMTGNSASRYWTLTETGSIVADLSFTYRNEDVNGDENTYKVLRRSGGFTVQSPSSTNNPATNTATILNISNFSDWAVGNAVPTAANASIGGRVLTASGQGIRNATVVISGGSLTTPRYATTGTFGYYQFDGLPVGDTYVVTVVSKRYTFPTPSRVINLQDSVTGEDFVADQQ